MNNSPTINSLPVVWEKVSDFDVKHHLLGKIISYYPYCCRKIVDWEKFYFHVRWSLPTASEDNELDPAMQQLVETGGAYKNLWITHWLHTLFQRKENSDRIGQVVREVVRMNT